MDAEQTHSPMQVAEVRRCLLAVRTMWGAHTPDSPINLMTVLPNGMPMHEFAYEFVLAHHNKRMNRNRST